MKTVKINKRETSTLQNWFGSGKHDLDAEKASYRIFNWDELMSLSKPTYAEFEEERAPARELLWDLFKKAEAYEELQVIYSY